mgnify:FL=1
MKRILTIFFLAVATTLAAQDASTILKKSEAYLRGAQSTAEVSITTVRPGWQRTMDAKLWNKGTDMSCILITGPKRDAGTVFMKNGEDIWNYVPAIKKLVALPAALVQNWMGTDISNDALINAGALTVDYTPEITGSKQVAGADCWVLELTPKPDAPVVWGRIVAYIDKATFVQLGGEFYDEDEFLVTEMQASELTNFDGRKLPKVIKMVPAEDPESYTEIRYSYVDFTTPIPDSFFTKANIKNVE